MDARTIRAALLAASLASLGASYRSQNFVTQAPTPEMARTIGQAAEQYRRELAIEWLGKEMPPWSQPCPIRANVAPNLGAGGATSFLFDRGEVYGWRMDIQGSLERILDSVLPHEVTHTIFACHFRRALPRWADEGACTTVEHQSERQKQERMLIEFLQTNRGIPFSQMFAMKEYPRDVLPLYSQGHSLARFLLGQGGKAKFLEFLADGMQDENWPRAVRKYYGHGNLAILQNAWLDWVRRGSPPLDAEQPATLVAQQTPARGHAPPKSIYRAQSADTPLVSVERTRPDSAARADADPGPQGARPAEAPLERVPPHPPRGLAASAAPAAPVKPYPRHLKQPVARRASSPSGAALDTTSSPPDITTWPADPVEPDTAGHPTAPSPDRTTVSPMPLADARSPAKPPSAQPASAEPSSAASPKREVVLEWSRPPGHGSHERTAILPQRTRR